MDLQTAFPPLNLPPAQLDFTNRGGRIYVRCQCRKEYVALTPEEWVRQHIIAYLVQDLNYPLGLVAAERMVVVNGLRQRADVIVFSRTFVPLMVVECKAPTVAISQRTMAQALRYVSKLGARSVVLTNGIEHFCTLDGNFVKQVPRYEDLE